MRSESERVRRRLTLRILPILVVALSVAAISAVTPLAYASPPDPSWVKGIYDDADFDDVVGLVTSAKALVEPMDAAALHVVSPATSLEVSPRESTPNCHSTGTLHARAPPAS